jgi:hypothetical protein
MPDARKPVPMDVLAKWLTTEVRKSEGCEDCLIRGVYRLREPDADGCNWSTDGGYMRATGVPRQILDPAMADVIARARQHFNLAEEDED